MNSILSPFIAISKDAKFDLKLKRMGVIETYITSKEESVDIFICLKSPEVRP